jgi:hypothetical protein
LGFDTGQIAIFIGELYFMLPFTVQVKTLHPLSQNGNALKYIKQNELK